MVMGLLSDCSRRGNVATSSTVRLDSCDALSSDVAGGCDWPGAIRNRTLPSASARSWRSLVAMRNLSRHA